MITRALVTLTDNSDLLFFVYDPAKGGFIYVNTRFLELFGMQAGESHPASLLAMVHPDDQTYVRERFSNVTDGPVELECRFVKGSDERTLRINARLIIENGRKIITGHAEDITAFVSYNKTLAEHGSKKNAILNILTHDLAGPIGSIGNYCELIRRDLPGEGGQRLRAQIESIQKISKRCTQLIRDFIDQEFLESAGVQLVKRRIDLAGKLSIAADEYQAMEDEMKVRVTYRATNTPVYVALDEDKFMQAIQNLISNALKFTPEGGTITLDVKEDEERDVIVSIADTGIGIPEKFHATLFDKFSEARRKGLHGEHSTGLGMAIVKTIVEWHGGKVWFVSEENKGTTFYIRIPKD